MKKERRRNVVRQVADDAQVAAERCEVEFECIGDVHRESIGREFGDHPGGEVAIDLDDGETAYALKQRPRERTKARADLDEVVVRVQMQRGDDPIDVMPIDQEML